MGYGPGMQSRLITKEHAKTIADAGGVVGVWTHQGNTPAEYIQAVREMVNAAGIDNVCIGTDSKLIPGGTGPGGRPAGPGGPGSEEGRGAAQKKGGGPGQGAAGWAAAPTRPGATRKLGFIMWL